MGRDDLMEHATSSVDFYALLGVAFETSESDIRRAYRKTALKYHPDKLGKDFDPAKFHLLQIANDVLSDPAAKAAYDTARNARLQKQRQHELFEGKRRQMKEDLEARERGGTGGAPSAVGGGKRAREEDEMESEIRRLAEEGKRRRKEMEEKMRTYNVSSPSLSKFASPTPSRPAEAQPAPHAPEPALPQTAAEEAKEEDEVARLERRIRELAEQKAKRRAEKKARKSGIYVPSDTPSASPAADWKSRIAEKQGGQAAAQATSTPIKRPDLSGVKADNASAASSPKFSFSPKLKEFAPKGVNDEFAATMERLKEAEKRRLEEEIRRQEAAETSL
jgi:DnaJ family protein C protein 17